MKNILKYRVLFLVMVLALAGCAGEFLEEPKPTQVVSEEVIFGSRAGVEAFLSGLARTNRNRWASQDSGGIMSFYFARALKGNDMINAQPGSWWQGDYALINREPTYRRCTFSWDFSYYMINQTNNIINKLPESSLSEKDILELSAQAKALRAFYYFQLVLEFSHTYSFDRAFPAPPIYTELSLEGKPMSTVGEVYEFIVSDLTDAVMNLTNERLGKSYMNKQVAAGILARVYLVMEDWAGAEEMAKIAYEDDLAGAFAPELYGSGFDDISNPEWIWGLPQTDDQSVRPVLPAAYIDIDNAPYKITWMNKNFTDQFSETDVRNTFVQNPTGNEFRKVRTTKWKFAFSSDYVVMRKPEMVLIEAEARFRQGDEDGARSLLYFLQQNRDPEAVESNNTGSDLEEEILFERRKELYGEFGVEWFDAKRLQRSIVRSENHRIVLTLEPNDPRFLLKIPQSEIDANENIDASINDGR